jgi:hypothetical protein
MQRMRVDKSRKPRLARTAAFLIATACIAGSVVAVRADSSGGASVRDKQMREAQKKEFLREHSDASGKPRPDLWRSAVEQQKNMQVAPYIGWHPPSDDAKKSGSSSTK